MAVPPFRIHSNSNFILYARLSSILICYLIKGNSLDLLDNVRAVNLVQEQKATHSMVGPK